MVNTLLVAIAIALFGPFFYWELSAIYSDSEFIIWIEDNLRVIGIIAGLFVLVIVYSVCAEFVERRRNPFYDYREKKIGEDEMNRKEAKGTEVRVLRRIILH